jgi:SAM-dependent methyltransferase
MVSRMAQFGSRREQWKDRLPITVRVMARRGKAVGRQVGKTLGKQLLDVRDTQWARVVMDRETEKFVRSLDYSTMDAVEVAGKKWESFGFRSYRNVNYPEYDLCEKPIDVAAFDIVIAEQVLEHVLWPYRAVRNVIETLRPGGVFVVTTPFLIPIHEHPFDCSRWSETGLKQLLVESGFSSGAIVTGSWGNRACVCANFQRWVHWIPWKHSLKNDSKFPVHVWAFARKNDRKNCSLKQDHDQ